MKIYKKNSYFVCVGRNNLSKRVSSDADGIVYLPSPEAEYLCSALNDVFSIRGSGNVSRNAHARRIVF